MKVTQKGKNWELETNAYVAHFDAASFSIDQVLEKLQTGGTSSS